ncbi:glutamate-1-semialdehyde 2,1-aminomutase [Marinoscillum furvescens]|uniref:Glutamate-1-semialdehyde 2,1-aminomutase n=1 Tax=Marinoscillum furvescens DSM 4134 TaxID=1122208 RepID=A0A3D9L3D6_MARFU|nr:glutamate-1-semialdehyde 2,1-aminomutase [Marinoscillum furvescens]RED97491.1 glutamate-1-semialdehyde 2,1-aminomutase [Marinoscillum furvescens DSM 4134]
MKIEKSKSLFSRAKNYIPGGVNSPVRAFKAVGGDPIFFKSASGAYMYDEDGNKYIDMINSWGPMILGHAHEEVEEAIIKAVRNSPSFGAPAERELLIAELICEMVPSVERVRMVNSGTEATMSAIRVARGYTGRDKIIKFDGCYHGHGDSFLIAAGSGAMTMGTPNSPGVTAGTAKDTLQANFNDLEGVKQVVADNKDEIAAIILEPVPGNMGCVLPQQGFLEGLRQLCDEEGIVLIFDEVMSGFRLAKGGAQERLGVIPDMTTLGKIIGGGMPVGAYGGKKEIMDYVSPQGPVYQAGTLSGNPVAMAAGHTILNYLYDHPETYGKLESNTKKIVAGYKETLDVLGLDMTINQIGSMYSLFFTDSQVTDFESAKKCDTAAFGQYFNLMLQHGIYLAPSQFETLFVSAVLSDEDIQDIISANDECLRAVMDVAAN